MSKHALILFTFLIYFFGNDLYAQVTFGPRVGFGVVGDDNALGDEYEDIDGDGLKYCTSMGVEVGVKLNGKFHFNTGLRVNQRYLGTAQFIQLNIRSFDVPLFIRLDSEIDECIVFYADIGGSLGLVDRGESLYFDEKSMEFINGNGFNRFKADALVGGGLKLKLKDVDLIFGMQFFLGLNNVVKKNDFDLFLKSFEVLSVGLLIKI